jgi:hypothetical protein
LSGAGASSSSGQRQKAKASKIVFDSTSGKFGGIPKSLLERWEKACPALDIEQELAKAGGVAHSQPEEPQEKLRPIPDELAFQGAGQGSEDREGRDGLPLRRAGGGLKVVSKRESKPRMGRC